jgi:translation elongation factor P/translation initiation factor 5A
MKSEFIYRPTSGEYEEKHFGDITPNCLWVKFVDKDENEWVGSFSESWVEEKTFILNLYKIGKSFIVARGQAYLIDINSKIQLNKNEISDIQTAILNEKENKIYYSTGFDLRFMDEDGNEFILFDKYYFDEIKLVEIKENKLYATYWNYQTSNNPFHFEINLITKEVKDSFYNAEKKEYVCENPKPNFLEKISNWFLKK